MGEKTPKCFRFNRALVWLDFAYNMQLRPNVPNSFEPLRGETSASEIEVRLDPNEDYPNSTDAEIEAQVTEGDTAIEGVPMYIRREDRMLTIHILKL
ncbi:hypothetical protein TNCT_449621 [Trichonephila clavata]|uniref:Uncharacterized protein n=1 Tax=Trichonephila clavata TaxID=2740835 RepID=A0A8X6JGU7_TRICU|nr:hypothetical protein TNCT_449621 [Trichonephila clavata]